MGTDPIRKGKRWARPNGCQEKLRGDGHLAGMETQQRARLVQSPLHSRCQQIRAAGAHMGRAKQRCPPVMTVRAQPACASTQLPLSNRPDCHSSPDAAADPFPPAWPAAAEASRPAMASRASSRPSARYIIARFSFDVTASVTASSLATVAAGLVR